MKSTRLILLVFISLGMASITCAQSIESAISMYEKKQFKDAKGLLKTFNSNHSDYAKAQFYLGRIAFDTEDYDKAQDYFEEALDEKENNAAYYYWYGNATGMIAQNSNMIKQGMLAPKVKNAYEKAIELDPKLTDAHWALMEYYTLAPGFMGGSWEKATESAKRIGALDRVRGYQAMATVYQRQEKFDLAEKEYIKLSQANEKFVFDLGYFYQNQKKYNKAFEVFENAYEKNTENTGALYQIGRTSALSGQQKDKGIKSLNKYLTIPVKKGQPSHAAAKMRLAMIYEKNGKKDLAIKFYKESLSEDSNMKLAKEGLDRLD